MTILDEIEAQYAFVLPAAYRAMATDGCFDTADHRYLWLGNCEWLAPTDILRWEPRDFHKPGFVPFGHNGGGDHWSWWPTYRPDLIVMCPHDYELGEYDSPTFDAFLYHRALEYALGGFDLDDAHAARQQLRDWSERLLPYIPADWCNVLRSIGDHDVRHWTTGAYAEYGLLTPAEFASILRRDFGFAEMGQEFVWMEPLR